ncbi:MAG TPA: hypothetical protein EYP25_10315 [Anaerolineae bacterium]|nr:hypothetical protein [Anaerolineae bacterium]
MHAPVVGVFAARLGPGVGVGGSIAGRKRGGMGVGVIVGVGVVIGVGVTAGVGVMVGVRVDRASAARTASPLQAPRSSAKLRVSRMPESGNRGGRMDRL